MMLKKSRISWELKGVWTIAKKDMRIYYLKAPVLIFGIVFPFSLYLAFALGRHISPAYLVPGMIGMAIFFTSSAVGPIIAPWETRMKTLERLVSCPISFQAILLGDILAGLIFGIIISFVPLILGIFIFEVSIGKLYLLLLGIFLSAFCFSALGIWLSSPPTDNPSNVMMLSNLVRLPIVFISGIFIPVSQLPIIGRIVALFSPLTYTVDFLRHSLQGDCCYPVVLDGLMLLAFLILFLILGLKFHKRNLAKRL